MEGIPKDDFKWFGEGFDGFPKRLPDDCVEYTVLVIDHTLQELAIRAQLRGIQAATNALKKELLGGYIWQRDSLDLSLVREGGTSFLHGRTNYGDSIEDEWLVVFLLREVSKKFSNAWFKIIDTDGEFLLVEAASTLPRWLNPEIADNRVWLNSGKLLILPIQQTTSQASQKSSFKRSLTVEEACDLIQKTQSKLLHSPMIEAEAFYRLRNYPGQIKDNLHHSLIKIPRKLAYILHENPAYISQAVESFYLRDPIAVRPLQSRNKSDLVFPPLDLVTTLVKFTKVGFAQLRSQQFPPPPQWSSSLNSQGSLESKSRAEMGMKVTCGFEMLLSDFQNQDKRAVREIKLLIKDLETGQDQLPSDAQVAIWGTQGDDETWLDINFEDFEKELSGKHDSGTHTSRDGFGDKVAQENLRKMVSRFEDFLNDETAGIEGAEFLDDMDHDDAESADSASGEDSDEADVSSEDEDKAVSFDEAQFAKMMKEMMGMPSDAEDGSHESRVALDHANPHVAEATDSGGEGKGEDDEEEIRQLTQAMEAELKAAGALRLDRAAESKEGRDVADEHDGDDEDEGEVNIDYNLAQNMLESFRSQAGMSGPGGNLLGLMGSQLPRDEEAD